MKIEIQIDVQSEEDKKFLFNFILFLQKEGISEQEVLEMLQNQTEI